MAVPALLKDAKPSGAAGAHSHPFQLAAAPSRSPAAESVLKSARFPGGGQIRVLPARSRLLAAT